VVVVAPPVDGGVEVVVVVVGVVVVGVVVVVVGVVLVELSDFPLGEAVGGHCVINGLPRQAHGLVAKGGQIVELHTGLLPDALGAQNLTFDASV